MGKLTISMTMFNSYVSHYQRVNSQLTWPMMSPEQGNIRHFDGFSQREKPPCVKMFPGWFPEGMSVDSCQLPSGKRFHNYGKSPCLMGKSTISMAIFNSYVSLPEGSRPQVFLNMSHHCGSRFPSDPSDISIKNMVVYQTLGNLQNSVWPGMMHTVIQEILH